MDGDHSFSMYAKFSKKLTFLSPCYERVRKWMIDFMRHPNLTFLIAESNLPFIFTFCIIIPLHFNPWSANPTKWSNTQIIRRRQPNCNELFDCVRPFCGVGAWRLNSFHYLKYWEEIFLWKFFFSFLFLKHFWKIFHSIHLFFLIFGLNT